MASDERLGEIIDGPDDDARAAEKLVAEFGFSPTFAAELVLANRHEGIVDNVAIPVEVRTMCERAEP